MFVFRKLTLKLSFFIIIIIHAVPNVKCSVSTDISGETLVGFISLLWMTFNLKGLTVTVKKKNPDSRHRCLEYIKLVLGPPNGLWALLAGCHDNSDIYCKLWILDKSINSDLGPCWNSYFITPKPFLACVDNGSRTAREINFSEYFIYWNHQQHITPCIMLSA